MRVVILQLQMYKIILHDYDKILQIFQKNSTQRDNILIIKSLNLRVMNKKIGQLIRERVDLQKMEITEFARLIGVERSNAYDIFKRESLDTKLLKKIGQVLNYDFFQDLLEEKTIQEIILKSKIEPSVVYIPIKLTEEEINKWLDTGNAWDKAGAYAIQQEFAIHIDKINGSYATVVGLPVHLVYDALKNLL